MGASGVRMMPALRSSRPLQQHVGAGRATCRRQARGAALGAAAAMSAALLVPPARNATVERRGLAVSQSHPCQQKETEKLNANQHALARKVFNHA